MDHLGLLALNVGERDFLGKVVRTQVVRLHGWPWWLAVRLMVLVQRSKVGGRVKTAAAKGRQSGAGAALWCGRWGDPRLDVDDVGRLTGVIDGNSRSSDMML